MEKNFAESSIEKTLHSIDATLKRIEVILLKHQKEEKVMMRVVNLGNGIEVDLGVTRKCAVDALKAIERELPREIQCKAVYDLIVDDMKAIIDTSPISIFSR